VNRGRGLILAALGASMAASIGVTVVYALGGQPQIEGVLLGIALGGIAVGLVLFGHRVLPGGHFVQARDVVPPTTHRPEVAASFEEGAGPIERRRLIATAFAGSIALLGAAAVFPIRSLGTRPGRQLDHTSWRRGLRAVTDAGRPLRVDGLDPDSVVTVFPEGHEGSADSQTLLIRLPGGVAPPGPRDWTVNGVVAFSKICTHAGCPVGLYQTDTQELFCPCHQSTFSVPEGARPTFGPATRPLPQLPIGLDGDGFIIALSDYTEPVGPGFWNRP
jgi:ubiquinol-cytochrome c reductase iron-sulfur subunit